LDDLTEKVKAAKPFNMNMILASCVHFKPCEGATVVGIKSIEDATNAALEWNKRGREYMCPSICLAFIQSRMLDLPYAEFFNVYAYVVAFV
jgi:hypothetical protein